MMIHKFLFAFMILPFACGPGCSDHAAKSGVGTLHQIYKLQVCKEV
jgi:hypothetical protein